MDRFLITVSFGTSDKSALKELEMLEDSFEKRLAVPSARAFTCRSIIESHPQSGHIHFSEALEMARGRILVQPTHLTCGGGYETIRIMAEEYDALLAPPLLSSEDDMTRAADILASKYMPEYGRTVMLAGHGIAGGENLEYEALEHRLHSIGRNDFIVCLMNGCKDFRSSAERIGSKRVLIVPLMVTFGHHCKNEICGSGPESLVSLLASRGFETSVIKSGLASDGAFRTLWLSHLERLS